MASATISIQGNINCIKVQFTGCQLSAFPDISLTFDVVHNVCNLLPIDAVVVGQM
jgi:hypothetical protein